MRVLLYSSVFLLLTLHCLCITSLANALSTAPITANASNPPATLTLFSQAGIFTDSSPSLVVYPSPLNEQNCQTSNHKIWTCVVTLEGQNLTGILVIWHAFTPTSGISISPNTGNLVELAPTIRVTISNIPCMYTYFLFSGQVYGGGGVIPATETWSCTQQPTPTTTFRPTPIPSSQPSPTSKKLVPTSTIVATITPGLTPTNTSLPTSAISSSVHSDPPMNGNLAENIFMISAFVCTLLVALIELVIIVLMSRRMKFKER